MGAWRTIRHRLEAAAPVGVPRSVRRPALAGEPERGLSDRAPARAGPDRPRGADLARARSAGAPTGVGACAAGGEERRHEARSVRPRRVEHHAALARRQPAPELERRQRDAERGGAEPGHVPYPRTDGRNRKLRLGRPVGAEPGSGSLGSGAAFTARAGARLDRIVSAAPARRARARERDRRGRAEELRERREAWATASAVVRAGHDGDIRRLGDGVRLRVSARSGSAREARRRGGTTGGGGGGGGGGWRPHRRRACCTAGPGPGPPCDPPGGVAEPASCRRLWRGRRGRSRSGRAGRVPERAPARERLARSGRWDGAVR